MCRVIVDTLKVRQAKFGYKPASERFETAGILPTAMSFLLPFSFVSSPLGKDSTSSTIAAAIR